MEMSKLYRVLVVSGSVLTLGTGCGFEGPNEGAPASNDPLAASSSSSSTGGGGSHGSLEDAGQAIAVLDAGREDAGVADAGVPDAGVVDAGGVGSWLSWA